MAVICQSGNFRGVIEYVELKRATTWGSIIETENNGTGIKMIPVPLY
jgi:hypothetical protein